MTAVPRGPGSHHKGTTVGARRSLLARRSSLQGRLGDGLAAEAVEAVRLELSELDAALLRLDEGTWGRCERCGGGIGRDRLRALPEARFCLPCSRK